MKLNGDNRINVPNTFRHPRQRRVESLKTPEDVYKKSSPFQMRKSKIKNKKSITI